jgi:hypothetical protein
MSFRSKVYNALRVSHTASSMVVIACSDLTEVAGVSRKLMTDESTYLIAGLTPYKLGTRLFSHVYVQSRSKHPNRVCRHFLICHFSAVLLRCCC